MSFEAKDLVYEIILDPTAFKDEENPFKEVIDSKVLGQQIPITERELWLLENFANVEVNRTGRKVYIINKVKFVVGAYSTTEE